MHYILVLKAWGIGNGDEVIVPLIHTLQLHWRSHMLAKPVFVEPEIDSFNIEVNRIEEKNNKTYKSNYSSPIAGEML